MNYLLKEEIKLIELTDIIYKLIFRHYITELEISNINYSDNDEYEYNLKLDKIIMYNVNNIKNIEINAYDLMQLNEIINNVQNIKRKINTQEIIRNINI